MVAIKKMLCPESVYELKSPSEIKPECIIVHNTANNAPAVNEVSFMLKKNKPYSFHYVIDDKEIIQCLPETRCSLDTKNKRGKDYLKGINIEICHSLSGGDKFFKSEENTAEYIASILRRYNWDLEKVKKHQDFDGTYCPHRTLDLGWERFLNLVKKYFDKTDNEEASAPTSAIKTGDLVTVSSNAHYYKSTKPIPSWIKNDKWYVDSVLDDKVIINTNLLSTQSINTAIHSKFLTVLKTSNVYKVKVAPQSGINCRTGPSSRHKIITTFSKGTALTVTHEEKNWGKTAMGWINLDNTTRM